MDRTRLSGPPTLTSAWAKSLLKRMNFTKRRGMTKATMPVEQFKEKERIFLQEIVYVVKVEVSCRLILNWDQTGLNLIPALSWTMDRKGSKRVEIK